MNECKWSWSVPDGKDITVENNHVLSIGVDILKYNPFDFPNLPNTFAKVENIDSIIKFVSKYGFLGYYHLLDDSYGTINKGDPIEWILVQAKTVRFAMYLIKAIQNNNIDDIKSLINTNAIKLPMNYFKKAAPDELQVSANVFAEGSEIIYRPLPMLESNEWIHNEKLLAIQIINLLINNNTTGIRRKIVINHREYLKIDLSNEELRPIPQFTARALIEVIWYLVGNALLLAFEDNGKNIKTCEECGLPFVATDNRQRFCPGDQFSKSSICGNKNRVRNYRKGKTT